MVLETADGMKDVGREDREARLGQRDLCIG